jgi:metallophosphoesterase (TIGR00282 family)
MKIVFIGDIVGRSGREALECYLPHIKEKLQPDFIIANGENAAHGFGITAKICQDLYAIGVDCITTGNHIWDQKEIMTYIDSDPRLIRPINYPAGTVGRGASVFTLQDGRSILVINAMARIFMDPLDDPFAAVMNVVQQYPLGQKINAIFVDFHGETSSEKMAMAHYLDGKISALVGTHTHIPTADAHILPLGTAYQTDAGMSGDYNSIIGMKTATPIHKFTKKTPPAERMSPADGEGTLCGVFIETNDQTGKATRILPIRLGKWLQETVF